VFVGTPSPEWSFVQQILGLAQCSWLHLVQGLIFPLARPAAYRASLEESIVCLLNGEIRDFSAPGNAGWTHMWTALSGSD
jgi:hypothetical protein